MSYGHSPQFVLIFNRLVPEPNKKLPILPQSVDFKRMGNMLADKLRVTEQV